MAVAAEQAGADAVCTGEFADRNAYVIAGQMAAATERMQVGTAIAYAFARSPFVHASSARQLEELAPGRVFLGLGTGSRRMNESWFSTPFAPVIGRMRELVESVRMLLHADNGEHVRYEGEHYALDMRLGAPVLGRVDVPILLGSFNRGMCRLAGGTADGIIGHSLFTDRWWRDIVDPALDRAARDASRDPTSLHRWGLVMVAVDDEDPARAERDARRMIAFYLTVKAYDPLVRHHGWEGPVDELRGAFARKDTDAMAAAVTEEMLDAIAVCGTTQQAREQWRARARLPDLALVAPPSFMVSPQRFATYLGNAISLLSAP